MDDSTRHSPAPTPRIPPDDPGRTLSIARPNEDPHLPHIGLVGDTYTILLTGQDTAGRYCLIDMHVPPGGGQPSPRHPILWWGINSTLFGKHPLDQHPEPHGAS
jgi:hypothetical protein